MRTIDGVFRAALVAVLAGSAACSLMPNHRVTYDEAGAQVGLEDDPTLSSRRPERRNSHPASLTPNQIKALLRVVQVSGWSGTLMGIFVTPPPVPLLSEPELQKYAGPLAGALSAAAATERVFFSFPKPGVTYSPDRTAGALFIRDRYLHVVVNDHSSILRADTGGGDADRDVRDTKGMKLSVATPAQEAVVPDADVPRWAPFESVHISMNVRETLAALTPPASRPVRDEGKTIPPAGDGGPSRQELQNQVKELTNSNLDLRERLDDQAKRTKELSDEVNRLRQELEQNPSGKSAPRKNPSP